MKYIIKPGFGFRDSDLTIKTGGDVIELSDDVAAAQRDKIDPVINSSAEEAAPAPADPYADHHVAD